MSLLELSNNVAQDDVVGASFNGSFIPLSVLSEQTTGTLELFGEEEYPMSDRIVVDREDGVSEHSGSVDIIEAVGGETDAETDRPEVDLRIKINELKREKKQLSEQNSKKPKLEESEEIGESSSSNVGVVGDQFSVEEAQSEDLSVDQSVGQQDDEQDSDDAKDYGGV